MEVNDVFFGSLFSSSGLRLPGFIPILFSFGLFQRFWFYIGTLASLWASRGAIAGSTWFRLFLPSAEASRLFDNQDDLCSSRRRRYSVTVLIGFFVWHTL